MGSVVLPHLRTAWHVDQAILSEEERLVVRTQLAVASPYMPRLTSTDRSFDLAATMMSTVSPFAICTNYDDVLTVPQACAKMKFSSKSLSGSKVSRAPSPNYHKKKKLALQLQTSSAAHEVPL